MEKLKNIPFGSYVPSVQGNEAGFIDFGDHSCIFGARGEPTCGSLEYLSEYTTMKVAGTDGFCVSGTSPILLKSNGTGLKFDVDGDNPALVFISGDEGHSLELTKFKGADDTITSGYIFM